MRLRELRQQKKLTQFELSKVINSAVSTYNGYELETSEPSLQTLKVLADYFGVTLDYLCEHETKNNLDISNFNENQKGIVFAIQKLNERNQIILLGYILHMLQEQQNNI